MTTRRPLVIVDGLPAQLPAGDGLAGDTAAIAFSIDGGGSAIATGLKGMVGPIPFACTIIQWTLLADQSGSIVVDIWSDAYGNYPPTNADTLFASGKPTIASATKGQSGAISVAVPAGSILAFNVDSVATLQRVDGVLSVVKG